TTRNRDVQARNRDVQGSFRRRKGGSAREHAGRFGFGFLLFWCHQVGRDQGKEEERPTVSKRLQRPSPAEDAAPGLPFRLEESVPNERRIILHSAAGFPRWTAVVGGADRQGPRRLPPSFMRESKKGCGGLVSPKE